MKKVFLWIYVFAIPVFVICWGLIGIKLLDHDYDFQLEASIAMACTVVIFTYSFYKLFSNRCSHCGKIRWTKGSYCSYCGKKLD